MKNGISNLSEQELYFAKCSPIPYGCGKEKLSVTKIQVRNSSLIQYEKFISKEEVNWMNGRDLETNSFAPDESEIAWSNYADYKTSSISDNKDSCFEFNSIEEAYPVHDIRKLKKYSGQVKEGTKKRIRRALDIFLQVNRERVIFNPVSGNHQKFTVGFITLTIPYNESFISGKVAHKLALAPFIDWLHKTKKINMYLWKAERQQPLDSNGKLKHSLGQLHYHIIVSDFIHYQEIRDKWNYLMKKNNWLPTDDAGEILYNPNSTDVHAVTDLEDLEAYLSKYVAKSQYSHVVKDGVILELPKNEKGKHIQPKELAPDEYLCKAIEVSGNLMIVPDTVEGKVWDCSKNIKGKKLFEFDKIVENNNRLEDIRNFHNVEVVQLNKCSIIKSFKSLKHLYMSLEQLFNYCCYICSILYTDFTIISHHEQLKNIGTWFGIVFNFGNSS